MSQSATTFAPGIRVKRATALGPRIPSPMNPTRTVSIGAAAKATMSVCPAGRGGSGMGMGNWPCAEAATDSAAARISDNAWIFML